MSQSFSPVPYQTEEKSLLTAALLGLLGPIGWLYAGKWTEALPAVAIFALLMYLPFVKTLLFFGAFLLLPASMLVGVLYAMAYNKNLKRTPLLLPTKKGS